MSFGNITNVNINKIGDSKSPMMVYYNFDIINGKTVDEGFQSDPIAQFNETRDTPIIKDCSQYYFSIVRFTMNGTGRDIPVFLPRIEIGQANPNRTVYYIGLELEINEVIGGVPRNEIFRNIQFIEFLPQNITTKIAPAPLTSQEVSNPYYYVYTIDHWLNLVNRTMTAVYNNITAQYSAYKAGIIGGGPYTLNTAKPFWKYNSDKTFSGYYDNTGFGTDGLQQENLRIVGNSNLYGLFAGFPNLYLGGDLAVNNGILNNWAYEFVVRNNLTNTETIGGTTYIVMKQEYISTGVLWSPVSSIVFVSNLIPILNEQTAEPIRFGTNNITTPTASTSAFQPIITDIALANDTADAYSNFVSYVPTAEYRLSTMTNSPTEVKNIDVSIFWKNRLDGNLYPLRMFNLSSVSVKILFRRRDYSS
jgi:hypothetical protein